MKSRSQRDLQGKRSGVGNVPRQEIGLLAGRLMMYVMMLVLVLLLRRRRLLLLRRRRLLLMMRMMLLKGRRCLVGGRAGRRHQIIRLIEQLRLGLRGCARGRE